MQREGGEDGVEGVGGVGEGFEGRQDCAGYFEGGGEGEGIVAVQERGGGLGAG